jgi:hypothetical protein
MIAQAGRAKPEFVIIVRIFKISASVCEHYCARPGDRFLAPRGQQAYASGIVETFSNSSRIDAGD